MFNVSIKMNPITKLVGVLVFGFSTGIFPNVLLGVGLLLVLWIIAFLTKMVKRFSRVVFGFGLPLVGMLLFIQGFYSPKNKTIIWDGGFAQLGLEGTMYALKLAITIIVMIGAFYLMNQTTSAASIAAAFTNIGVNSKWSYLLLATLNVVPQMNQKMKTIQEAQVARGIKTSGHFFHRIGAFFPIIVPVVLSSLTDAQERGMTLETRGFSGKQIKRTSFIQVPLSRIDFSLWLFLAALAIFSIVCKIRA